MRWLIFLLVLANLLFFAYTEGYFGRLQNPDAIRMSRQVKPENIRVVARDIPPPGKQEPAKATKNEESPAATHPPAEPIVETTSAKPAEICLAWGGLATKDTDRLAALITEKFSDFKSTQRSEKGPAKSWWVFIPPLATKADADKKVAELKKIGVKDYIVTEDSSPYRLAVSLGVFSTEAAGKSRLAELREKGVKSAKLEPYGSKETFVLEVRGPAAQQQNLLDATKSISSIKLEAKACQ